MIVKRIYPDCLHNLSSDVGVLNDASRIVLVDCFHLMQMPRDVVSATACVTLNALSLSIDWADECGLDVSRDELYRAKLLRAEWAYDPGSGIQLFDRIHSAGGFTC